jgi:hypothetical protein
MKALAAHFTQDLPPLNIAPAIPDNSTMAQRKRPTRQVILLPSNKPRNPVLQAAALGQLKLGTAKHEKSSGAKRQALKLALRKADGDSL